MRPYLRMFAVAAVFVLSSLAWTVLGGVMSSRSSAQRYELHNRVEGLWGLPQTQRAPTFTFESTPLHEVSRSEFIKGVEHAVKERAPVTEPVKQDVLPASSHLDVDLHLDQRLKGLAWYSLYDVSFKGVWTYEHADAEPGNLRVRFPFPDAQGMYDAFTFVVDGEPRDLQPKDGVAEVVVPVQRGQRVELAVGYKSRGLDSWDYRPTEGVGSLRNFTLAMTTDFAEIDFPEAAMSPSERTRVGRGWKLLWRFDKVVTGHTIGMAMPTKVQPGALAASLAFSAPISLGFFFLLLLVLARLRGLELHPVNYLFLASGFFAFHLLFAYSVDHLHVGLAFAIASFTSVALVVSYLRLVVSPRFAYREVAAAQLVYLVGFSLAHFWEGFTGLAVTVLSVLTLFLLMQLTGKVRWGEPAPAPAQGAC